MTEARSGAKLPKMFRSRDIFVHDGRSLRRLRVGGTMQAAIFAAVALTFLWAVFATARLAAAGTPPSGESGEIARMQREVKAMQSDVAMIRQAAEQRYLLTAREVKRLGMDPGRLQSETGVGGPYEPVDSTQTGDPSFKALFMSWKKLERIEQGTVAIPSSFPVRLSTFTSGFGVRTDPFRGRAAMHPGVDLAGPAGTPVYATADGMVDRAEWNNGGYGNLVEIDHGHGIQTRYGHLSRYIVTAGQRVKRGDLIAYMGSTGRSTGNHLHYEVRLDGKAVNPIPFMQSSDFLQTVQRRAAATTQVAVGGPETDD
jgi:murein DD-endopeptidase MepM/ murein hydrolase activator NlpD